MPLPTGWYDNAVEMKFPDAPYVAYYQGVGLSAIRLPLYWEEMQPILNGSLNARYLQHTREFLDIAQTHGMKVLIDLHNYARYRKVLIGSQDVPVASFAGFWKRLAGELKSHPAIFAWGLMNEPHHTGGTWPAIAQAGVDAIRSEDAARPIYVGGDNWSNAQTWPAQHPAPFVERSGEQDRVRGAHLFRRRFQRPLQGAARCRRRRGGARGAAPAAVHRLAAETRPARRHRRDRRADGRPALAAGPGPLPGHGRRGVPRLVHVGRRRVAADL
ncbi:MAG: cellulase family glycosylhydrolase [Propionivibrio sp.]